MTLSTSGADLRGAGQGSTTLYSTNTAAFKINNGADNVNLEGFTIKSNYTTAGQLAIWIADGAHSGLRFTDLTIDDMRYAGIYSGGTLTNSSFTRVVVNRCGDFGIHIDGGGSYVTFDDCHCPGEGFSGIAYAGLTEPPHGFYLKSCNNITMTDCTGGHTHNSQHNASGIDLDDVTDSTFYNCDGHEADLGIAVNQYPSTGCSNLYFYNCGGSGNTKVDRYEYGTNHNIVWENCYGSYQAYR